MCVCLVAMSVKVNIGNVASRYLCSNTKYVSTAMHILSAAFITHAASTGQLTVCYPPYNNDLKFATTRLSYSQHQTPLQQSDKG